DVYLTFNRYLFWKCAKEQWEYKTIFCGVAKVFDSLFASVCDPTGNFLFNTLHPICMNVVFVPEHFDQGLITRFHGHIARLNTWIVKCYDAPVISRLDLSSDLSV